MTILLSHQIDTSIDGLPVFAAAVPRGSPEGDGDRAWREHCADLLRRHDEVAAALIADGWQREEHGGFVSYTRNGARIQLRRNLGSDVWCARPSPQGAQA